jgi:site-specific recombinase XerD
MLLSTRQPIIPRCWHSLSIEARELRCSIETCRMITRAGEAARFTFLIHSHMLRHSCGYKLANDGHDTRPSSPK